MFPDRRKDSYQEKRSDVQDIELLRDCFGDALRKTIETLKVEYGPGAEITLLSHSITKM